MTKKDEYLIWSIVHGRYAPQRTGFQSRFELYPSFHAAIRVLKYEPYMLEELRLAGIKIIIDDIPTTKTLITVILHL